MQIQIKRTFGNSEILISQDVDNHIDFFKALSFFGDLPQVCGNCSETNLRFVHRTTKEGYEYCEIKCQDCKHILKFGQYNDKSRNLFLKGWEEPYAADDSDGEDEEEQERPAKKSKPNLFKKKLQAPVQADDSDEETSEEASSEEEETEEQAAPPKRNINDIAAKFGIKTKK